MQTLNLSAVEITRFRIAHPEGHMHATVWSPARRDTKPLELAPVVLLHDSLGCVALWRDFPAALCVATGRQVVAYDRLGFGESDPRYDRLGMGFVAEEATRYFPTVCNALGLKRFALLGHSVGGGMAVHVAAHFSGRCEALVTIAAQAFTENRTTAGIELAKAQFADDAQFQRLLKYHGDKARWVLDAWTETWLHPDFAHWTLADTLPQVLCPVLAIHGADDEYGSSRHPETIAALSSGPAQARLLPNTGHMPHRERAQEVLELVSSFLSPPVA